MIVFPAFAGHTHSHEPIPKYGHRTSAAGRSPRATSEVAGGDSIASRGTAGGRINRPEESGPVHKPRAQLARVQRACARAGAGPVSSAPRAREVLRHHGDEPRRV